MPLQTCPPTLQRLNTIIMGPWLTELSTQFSTKWSLGYQDISIFQPLMLQPWGVLQQKQKENVLREVAMDWAWKQVSLPGIPDGLELG